MNNGTTKKEDRVRREFYKSATTEELLALAPLISPQGLAGSGRGPLAQMQRGVGRVLAHELVIYRARLIALGREDSWIDAVRSVASVRLEEVVSRNGARAICRGVKKSLNDTIVRYGSLDAVVRNRDLGKANPKTRLIVALCLLGTSKNSRTVLHGGTRSVFITTSQLAARLGVSDDRAGRMAAKYGFDVGRTK